MPPQGERNHTIRATFTAHAGVRLQQRTTRAKWLNKALPVDARCCTFEGRADQSTDERVKKELAARVIRVCKHPVISKTNVP